LNDEAILDAERIFAALQEHGVEYVLIGGMAVQTHGHVRMTNDADLVPAPDPANLARLADALNAMGARVLNPGHEDEAITASMLPRSTVWQFTTRDGNIDVMHEVPGGREFEQLYRDAMSISLDNVEIQVVGLDDLVRMKLARGRDVDLADVAALTDDSSS
jgi:predicted nucleotidyltransferase